MIGPADIADWLSGVRFDLSTEAACQAGIHHVLEARAPEGCAVIRECQLGPRDRPDFLVGDRIAVEVKVSGWRGKPVLRQLTRYARHARVQGLVLVSGTALDLPVEVEGKPLAVVSLGRAWL